MVTSCLPWPKSDFLQHRSDHRNAILTEIETYLAIQNRINVPLANQKVLLASVAAYIKDERKDEALGTYSARKRPIRFW